MELKGKRMLKYYCDDCTEGVKLVPKLIAKIDSLLAEVNNLKSQIQLNKCDDEEVIISELQERQKKMNNIMIHNLPEPSAHDSSNLDTKVIHDILKEITGRDIKLIQAVRVGSKNKNGARSLKVILSEHADVVEIMSKKRNVCNDKRIYIAHDLTFRQREKIRTLKEELKLRKDNGENDIFIKYVRGVPKIMKQQKN